MIAVGLKMSAYHRNAPALAGVLENKLRKALKVRYDPPEKKKRLLPLIW